MNIMKALCVIVQSIASVSFSPLSSYAINVYCLNMLIIIRSSEAPEKHDVQHVLQQYAHP